MSQHGGRSFHRPNKQDTQEAGNGKTESKQIDDDEEEDPFDTRIKKSGCADLHYALLVSNLTMCEPASHVTSHGCESCEPWLRVMRAMVASHASQHASHTVNES